MFFFWGFFYRHYNCFFHTSNLNQEYLISICGWCKKLKVNKFTKRTHLLNFDLEVICMQNSYLYRSPLKTRVNAGGWRKQKGDARAHWNSLSHGIHIPPTPKAQKCQWAPPYQAQQIPLKSVEAQPNFFIFLHEKFLTR